MADTATTVNDEKHRDQREEDILFRVTQEFFKRWEPQGDAGERSQFYTEFFNLVRIIHTDSAKPYRRAMEITMANSLTLSALLPRKGE